MAYRKVFLVDVREIIRRWQDGQSQLKIARETSHARDTVRGYTAAAKCKRLTPHGPEPTERQLAEPSARNLPGPRDDPETPAADRLTPHLDRIRRMLAEEDLQLTRLHELLEKSGIFCTYSSLRRFCIREGLLQGKSRDAVRMAQTGPGEAMELDFGRLGEIWDADAGASKAGFKAQTVCAFSRSHLTGPKWGNSVIVNTKTSATRRWSKTRPESANQSLVCEIGPQDAGNGLQCFGRIIQHRLVFGFPAEVDWDPVAAVPNP